MERFLRIFRARLEKVGNFFMEIFVFFFAVSEALSRWLSFKVQQSLRFVDGMVGCQFCKNERIGELLNEKFVRKFRWSRLTFFVVRRIGYSHLCCSRFSLFLGHKQPIEIAPT